MTALTSDPPDVRDEVARWTSQLEGQVEQLRAAIRREEVRRDGEGSAERAD